MHLGNGIICPMTGIPMLLAAGAAAFWAFKKYKKDFSKSKILPLISVTALVFSLQMLNFSIPLTGSSGHIVGGILLAVLLGPYAAFLAICAILLVQAVFFADGGLLALGCNIFNMGIIACFAVYPLIYKPFEKRNQIFLGAFLSSIAALQLGALAVVAEGVLSASVSGNVWNFAGLMSAIHLPIGIVEGIVTGCAVLAAQRFGIKGFSSVAAFLAVVFAGVIAPYASSKPDGLEWSLLNISDSVVLQTQYALYSFSENIQAKSSILSTVLGGNIFGVFTVALVMYLTGAVLNFKTVKVDE